MPLTLSAEASVFRSVKRACYAGMDSVSLRREIVARVRPVVGYDAYAFSIVDPETVLFTHTLADGVPETVQRAWVTHLYPFEGAVAIADQARSGEAVRILGDGPVLDAMRRGGVGHELRAVLTARETAWGNCCLLREIGAPPFTGREAAFLRRLAPHLAQGLRTAHLRDRAQLAESGPAPLHDDASASPGVLVLDERGAVVLRNPAAAIHLQDLADDGMQGAEIPFVVASAAIQLRLRLARGDDAYAPLASAVRARGRSGRWYTLRASPAEPDAAGRSTIIVVVAPATSGEAGSILARLYGLTARESEIVAAAARGESTKCIARRLGLSPYTVQEHLGRACEKVGVRGRRALVARLFFDAYSPLTRRTQPVSGAEQDRGAPLTHKTQAV